MIGRDNFMLARALSGWRDQVPLLALVALAACATTSADVWTGRDVRAAEDVPTSFATEDGTPAVDACRNPMIDPRDQTRLRLVRSAPVGGSERGDYEVPDGRYGVRPGELLRLDCESGQVIGIVRN